MPIKNPYKLIEKANNTFNLYLEKYEDIEKFIVSSKKDQEINTELLNSILKKNEIHTNKSDEINTNIIMLLSELIKENQINKDLINNLSNELNKFNNEHNSKFSNITTTFQELNNHINNIKNNIENIEENNKNIKNNIENIEENNKNIKNDIKNNKDLIGIKSGKQIIEMRKLNEEISALKDTTTNKINEINNNLEEKIDTTTNKINEQNTKIEEKIDATSENLLNKIDNFNKIEQKNNRNNLEAYDTIKTLLNSQVDVTDNLNTAVKFFTESYEICKQYFFNNNEQLLKQYLNTDDLFRLCYFNNIQFLSFSPSENKILLRTKEGIILGTNNRYYTIKEVIGFDGYSVPQLYQFDEFVVFDIGMNRGYASLRFAEFKNCTSVYGFEIDDNTYNKATYNINLNPQLSEKIKTFNFGLSNINKKMKLYYLEGADGLNTLKQEFIDIQYELKDNKDKIKTKIVEVKKTSEILGELIKKDNITSNIVLKIDTEGSEYEIINELIDSKLIDEIDLILGEGHNFNNQDVTKKLLKNGFKEIEKKDNIIVYNFAYVREEYYDMWELKK